MPEETFDAASSELYALRLSVEFWRPVGERTPEEAEAGIRNYHWLPVVLATRAGYQDRPEIAVRTFLDGLTKEQTGHLVPALRAVLAELDPPTTEAERLSLYELQEMCDAVRARLMYDRSRGFTTDEVQAWTCLGWDVGRREGVGFRHPSEAVAKIFYATTWRPFQSELAWFRDGFARQREGSPRPTTRG